MSKAREVTKAELLAELIEMTAIARCISGSFAMRGEYGWNKDDQADLDRAESLIERAKRNPA